MSSLLNMQLFKNGNLRLTSLVVIHTTLILLFFLLRVIVKEILVSQPILFLSQVAWKCTVGSVYVFPTSGKTQRCFRYSSTWIFANFFKAEKLAVLSQFCLSYKFLKERCMLQERKWALSYVSSPEAKALGKILLPSLVESPVVQSPTWEAVLIVLVGEKLYYKYIKRKQTEMRLRTVNSVH